MATGRGGRGEGRRERWSTDEKMANRVQRLHSPDTNLTIYDLLKIHAKKYS